MKSPASMKYLNYQYDLSRSKKNYFQLINYVRDTVITKTAQRRCTFFFESWSFVDGWSRKRTIPFQKLKLIMKEMRKKNFIFAIFLMVNRQSKLKIEYFERASHTQDFEL